MTLIITSCGGGFPTQADGTMHGCPFYFRARWGNWSLEVCEPGADPVNNPAVYLADGDEPSGGCMDPADVEVILRAHLDAVEQAWAAWPEKERLRRLEEEETRLHIERMEGPLPADATPELIAERAEWARLTEENRVHAERSAELAGRALANYLGGVLRQPSVVDQLLPCRRVR